MPEKCSKNLIAACPGDGANCNGICQFQVCAVYDNIPDSKNIKNLKIEFRGSRAANPIVGNIVIDPLEGGLEAAVSGCTTNFNAGVGFVEYTDNAGNIRRLNNANYAMETDNIRRATMRNRNLMRRIGRIQAKGRCSNWDKKGPFDELKFMIEVGSATQVNGWNLKWICQDSEGGLGLSVSELKANSSNPITSFTLQFFIWVTCACPGSGTAPNRIKLNVNLTGP